ncbi:MAG: 4-hydroxyphenylacetate 3-hydroxylase N-terminal domain-containing protein [Desulfobacterales bacterium]
MLGELVEDTVNNPIIRPSLNAIGMTYEIAHQPEHEDLATATSHLPAKKSIDSAIFTRALRICWRKPRLLRLMEKDRNLLPALRR